MPDKRCVLVDVGDAVRGSHSIAAHAAPLAFEMSHGGDRLDCQLRTQFGAWCRLALAARVDWRRIRHWLLTPMSPTRSCATAGGAASRRATDGGRWQVTGRGVEDKSGIWLETSHAIFLETHGVRHNRRFFIDARGEDIRGEDFLLADMNHVAREGAGFHLRFHLHPHVKANMQSGGDAVLLMTPIGHGWQFRVGLKPRRRCGWKKVCIWDKAVFRNAPANLPFGPAAPYRYADALGAALCRSPKCAAARKHNG